MGGDCESSGFTVRALWFGGRLLGDRPSAPLREQPLGRVRRFSKEEKPGSPRVFLALPQTLCKVRRGEIRSWFKLGMLAEHGMICSGHCFVTLFRTLFGRGFPQKAVKAEVSH